MITPGKSITLKLIAEKANCSIAQVSSVLNKSKGGTVVSAARREKIQKIADALGYVPNFASQTLKKKHTKIIGIYNEPGPWRSMGNTYELTVFRGIERAAVKNGYDLLILNLSVSLNAKVCAEKLEGAQCDGLVLFRIPPYASWVEQLLARGKKLFAVECGTKIPGLSRTKFDEDAAMRLAFSKLLELGHRRIGFLGLGIYSKEPDRCRIFRECMSEFRCDKDDSLIFDHTNTPIYIDASMEYSKLSGIYGMRYMKSLANPPTALIAHDSFIAVSALQEAQKLGISIPENMSLVGIDNYDFISIFSPRLAAINHHLIEMGEFAVQHLIDQIEGKTATPIIQTFSPGWIDGESCRKIE